MVSEEVETVRPDNVYPNEELYTEDMFKDSANTLLKGMYGMPDSREYLQNELTDRIYRYKRHNPDITNEEINKIIRGEKYSISDLLRQQSAKGVPFTLAQGGRAGYAYGNEVTADDPGVVSRIPPEQANLIEGGQRYEKEMWDVWQEFYDRFPDSEDHTEENVINFLARNQFEDAMNTPG